MSASKPSARVGDTLSLLQNSAHLGVVTCSVDRVLSANDAYLNMIGFTREELDAGLVEWKSITTPESLARDEQAIRELRKQGACFPFEKEYILRDGTHVPVILGAVRYSIEPFEWICWITDLRPQKAREKAEQESRRLRVELDAEIRGAELVSEISNRLLGKSSVREVLTEILEAAIELTQADFGTLQLADGTAHRIVVQRGLSPQFIAFFDEVTHDTVAACGAAIKSGTRVIVEDVMTSELFKDNPAKQVLLAEGIRAVQATPLIGASGELYGVLSTHFRTPCHPTERALRLLDLVAARAGQLLESFQLAEVRRRAEGLRASGRLANSLAHEINNPVQTLTNLMTLLSEHHAVTVEGQPLVQLASEQLVRVTETLRRMLAVEFAPSSGRPRLSNLIEHMREEGGFCTDAADAEKTER
jgi:PAS domain S-box-containing protein